VKRLARSKKKRGVQRHKAAAAAAKEEKEAAIIHGGLSTIVVNLLNGEEHRAVYAAIHVVRLDAVPNGGESVHREDEGLR
jgi:hypothetical protein